MRTLIFILLGAGVIYAAQLCVNVPVPQETRVATAFGAIMNLRDAQGSPRPATGAELQSAMTQWLQAQVLDYERRQAIASFSPSLVVSPTPTATAFQIQQQQQIRTTPQPSATKKPTK